MRRMLKLVCACGIVFSTISNAQWTKVCGSYGGPSNLMLSCPDGSGGTELFVGTSHGPFRSTDLGVTWTAANTGFSDLVLSLTFNNYGVFGVSLAMYPDHVDGHILHSSDHGSSWTALEIKGNVGGFSSLAGLGDQLYAGSSLGVVVSGDSGKNWTLCADTVHALSLAVRVTASGDTTILAQGGNAVWRSSDGGRSWQLVLPGIVFIPPRTYTTRSFTALATHDSLAFVSNVNEIWRSTDDGITWSATGQVPFRFNERVVYLAADDSNLYATTWGTNGTH